MKAIELVLAVSVCVPALAQTGIIMSGSASNKNVHLSYETRLDPPSPPLKGLGGGVVVGSSVVHRYMMDSSERRYFGYDVELERGQEGNTYRITIRPLSLPPEKIVREPAAWTMVPLPVYPAPQIVGRGDTIALDLFTHPGTGQKIVDYLHIGESKPRGVPASGPARDFSIEEAELRIMNPRLTVNGKPEESAKSIGGVSGAWVWFYLPDRGRYFLSILPRSEFGFSKAGQIRGSSLSFTIGGDTISMDCNELIVPGNAAYNLYVLHDPAWRPQGPDGSYPGVRFYSSDKPPQSLVRR
jgi:hypothetical protein